MPGAQALVEKLPRDSGGIITGSRTGYELHCHVLTGGRVDDFLHKAGPAPARQQGTVSTDSYATHVTQNAAVLLAMRPGPGSRMSRYTGVPHTSVQTTTPAELPDSLEPLLRAA